MRAAVVAVLLFFAAPSAAEPTLDSFVVPIDFREAVGQVPTRPIGLGEALELALTTGLEATLARVDEQIARERRFVSDAALFPSLELGLSAGRLDGRVQGSFGNLRDATYSTYDRGAALVYRANIPARLKEAFAQRKSVEAAGFDRLGTEQRVILHVVELYQDLLLAGVAVQITHDVVATSDQFVKLIQARTKGGLSHGADVARAEAKLAVDRQELVGARTLLVNASTRLAVVLRRDVEVLLIPVDERLAPASYTRPSSRTPASRPDVQAATRRRAAAERLESSARWELYFPELRAELGHVRIGDTTDHLEGRDERAALLLWNLSPEVFGEIRQRKAEEQRAELQQAQIEDRAAGQIRRSERDLAGARDRIPLAGDGFRAASDTLRLNEARFKAGTAIVLEVLDAQNILARARFNLARAIVDYNTAQARLLAAYGTLDRASITE